MLIFIFLKWIFYIFSSVVALITITLLVFSLIDRRVPINQSTKTCLVTGASSGIGKALAEEMIKRGWKVIGVARRTKLLEKLKQQHGAENFIPYVCDVSNIEAVHLASDDMKAKGLKPTLFFLNAGINLKEEKDRVSVIDHQKVFATNYLGAVAWVDEWVNTVKTYGGGTFVATSSVAALGSAAGRAGYCASKVALLSCFRSFRLQYIKDNIGFSVILPGDVATESFSRKTFDKIQRGEKLPFLHRLLIHLPEDDAPYIVDQVFKGKNQIEPSPISSFVARLFDWLPA